MLMLPRPSMSLALLLCALFVPRSGLTMPVVGWVERVKIYPGEMILEAKLDTGAKTASINARDIETFERKGTPWVRFRIVNRDAHGLALERPLVRETKIQRHFGKRQRRPVVKLGVCVGDLYREVQVNLVNRSGFIYPMLIGRMFMKKELLVDPARRYTVAPKCAQAPKNMGNRYVYWLATVLTVLGLGLFLSGRPARQAPRRSQARQQRGLAGGR